MPINPYTSGQPSNFEYKSLGFEAFAKPFAEMQKGYDKSLMDAEDLETRIDFLKGTPDEEAGAQLQKDIEKAKQQVIDEIGRTKNYRQGSQQIAKLNKMYKEDAHRLALKNNLESFNAWDKQESERALKGETQQRYYDLNRRKVLEEYGKKGGTSFQGSTKKYNTIGTSNLLKDEEENLRKEAQELAKGSPEEKRNILGKYFAREESDRLLQAINTTYTTKAPSAKEMEAILRKSQHYSSWAEQLAGLDLYNLQSNPDAYKQTSENILKNRTSDVEKALTQVDNQAKSKDDKLRKQAEEYQKSDTYKQLKEQLSGYKEMIVGNKPIDQKQIDNIYQEQEIDKRFNVSKDYADFYTYQDIIKDRDNLTIPKEDNDGGGAAGYMGGLVGADLNPLFSETFTPENINSQISNSKSASQNYTKNFDKLGITNDIYANMYKEYEGPNKDFKITLGKDGKIWAKNKNGKGEPFEIKDENRKKVIREHIRESHRDNPALTYNRTKGIIDAFTITNGSKEEFIAKINKDLGIPISNAKNIYKKLYNDDNPQNLFTLNQELDNLAVAADNYTMAVSANKRMEEKLKTQPDYQNLLQRKEGLEYAIEELNKISIKNEHTQKAISIKQRELNAVNNDIKNKKANFVTSNKDVMIWSLDGTKKETQAANEKLTKLAPTAYIGNTFTPMFTTWSAVVDSEGNPMFDESGKPLPGTERDYAADRFVVIPDINKAGIVYGYKDKKGNRIPVTVKPKKGTSNDVNNTFGEILDMSARSDNPALANGSRLAQYDLLNTRRAIPKSDINKLGKLKKEETISITDYHADSKKTGEFIIKALPNKGDIGKPGFQVYFKFNDGSIITDGETHQSIDEAELKVVNKTKRYIPIK